MTDDLRFQTGTEDREAVTEDEAMDALYGNPFEDVPAEVWQEFTWASAMVGKGTVLAGGSAEDGR